MKKYEGNVKEWVENMRKYEGIYGKYEGNMTKYVPGYPAEGGGEILRGHNSWDGPQ